MSQTLSDREYSQNQQSHLNQAAQLASEPEPKSAPEPSAPAPAPAPAMQGKEPELNTSHNDSSFLHEDSEVYNDQMSSSNLPHNSSSTSLPSEPMPTSFPLPQPPENPANTVPSKTLWMGDLEAWWDEQFIVDIWAKLDKHVEVKVIKPKRNLLMHQLAKTNGQGVVNHSGYCFVEFDSPELATEALSLNGTPISGTNNNVFRLNWASAATLDSEIAQTPEFSLFVGDLSTGTTEAHLLALFQSQFNSIKTVRVMTDPSTGMSRCFGFVRFSNEDDRGRALVEMNGKWLGGRQIRVALASPKHQNGGSRHNTNRRDNMSNNNGNRYNNFNRGLFEDGSNNNMMMNNGPGMEPPRFMMNSAGGQMNLPSARYFQQPPGVNPNAENFDGRNMGPGNDDEQNFDDVNNTTVFVGGLANGLNEDTLMALFEPFGQIVNIKVPPGKGCGFVKFDRKIDAENAIEGMQGFVIGGSRMRLSWGRPNNRSRQFQHNPRMYAPNNPNMNGAVFGANGMGMNPNMNPIPFGAPSYNGFPSMDSDHQMGPTGNNGNELRSSSDLQDGNGAQGYLSQPHGQHPMMARSMYEYPPQGALPPGAIPAVLSPNHIPQPMVDPSYQQDGTSQGAPPALVGIPAGIPAQFMYDPYGMGVAPQQGGEGQTMPQQHQMLPTGMTESSKGGAPMHGPSHPHLQQYDGQYMFVPQQIFPPNAMMAPPNGGYDDDASDGANNSQE